MSKLLAIAGCVVMAAGVAHAEEPAVPAGPSRADLKKCNKGNGKACLTVGQQYLDAKDADKALAFYLKACKAKVALGCGFAGTMTMLGEGTTKNLAKGRDLREKACKLGDGGSCNDLGTSWSEGKDGAPEVDHGKARAYYEKACKLKDGLGCFNLGNVYREGEGVKVDLKKAFPLFEQSCDLDQARGCTELAIMYYEGKAVARDHAKALELLGRGCKLGSDVACKNLEILKKQKP